MIDEGVIINFFLVVDDSAIILKQMTNFIETISPEFKVLTASSAEEGIEIIKDKHSEISMVFVDYHMKGGTGLDLVEKSLSFLTIEQHVLCTASRQNEVFIKATKMGVKVCYKPLSEMVLKEILFPPNAA